MTGLNKYAQGGNFSKINNRIRPKKCTGLDFLIVVQGGKVNVGQNSQLKLKKIMNVPFLHSTLQNIFFYKWGIQGT